MKNKQPTPRSPFEQLGHIKGALGRWAAVLVLGAAVQASGAACAADTPGNGSSPVEVGCNLTHSEYKTPGKVWLNLHECSDGSLNVDEYANPFQNTEKLLTTINITEGSEAIFDTPAPSFPDCQTGLTWEKGAATEETYKC